MPSLGLRILTLAFSVFTPVTSYLAGGRCSVAFASRVSLFVISIFAMMSLCTFSYKQLVNCILHRSFLEMLDRGKMSSNHGTCTILNTLPEKNIGGCERQSCSFSLTSLLHTLRKWQTKIQRAGLMSSDSFLYMIPSSFQVPDWYWVYTGWTLISWLRVCMSSNQLWRFKE